MLFWLVIIGFTIGGIIFAFFTADGDVSEGILRTLVGIILGIVVAFIVCRIAAEVDRGDPTFAAPDPPAKIFNLEDSKEKKLDGNGTFVLVAGGFSIHEDTELTYSFYQETKKGSYFLHTIMADDNTNIRIHFIEDDETPYVVRKEPTPSWSTASWIAPMDLTPNRNDTVDETWTIYIPRGTILNKFKLDNK